MATKLNYYFKFSLKEIALRRIAIVLSNEPGILNFIAEFEFSCTPWWTEKRFHYVSHVLSDLRLPESLKNLLMAIFKAISDEILRWKLFHKKYLNGDIREDILKKLRWTVAGTVNYQKTAKELVCCHVLDIVKRFRLACFYCLEDYIPVLWGELPDEDKVTFYHGDVSRFKIPHLQLFLPNILERAESKLSHYCGLSNNYFERAAVLGNKTLADFCLRKLNEATREGSLVRAARSVIRYRNELEYETDSVPFIEGRLLSEVLTHLLSLMTAEAEIGIFKKMPCKVLRCFMDWPCQDLLLDFADVMWTFLPENEYKSVMRTIFHIFRNQGYYFPDSLQEFFRRSPVSFRKQFADHECRGGGFFCLFVRNEDTDTIRVFLRNLDAADRERLVFSERGLYLICYGTLNVVEVFLRAAALTQEQKQRLKQAFTEYAWRKGGIQWMNERFRRFYQFVDEGDAGAQSRRSSQDETQTGMKRRCDEASVGLRPTPIPNAGETPSKRHRFE